MTQVIEASPPQATKYRQERRRWVPKATLVLAALFIVGMLLA